MEFCLDSTTKELSDLINEKSITERTLDSLDNPLGVILECISIRDQRRQKELTNDEVEEGLKKVTELYICIHFIFSGFFDLCSFQPI